MNAPDASNDHRPKAIGLTILSYGALIAALYLVKLTYEPVIEQPVLGVDLNYGVDLVGAGDLQTLNQANDSDVADEMAPPKAAEKPVALVKPSPPAPSKPERVKPQSSPKIISSDLEKAPVVKNPVKPVTKPVSQPTSSTPKTAPATAPTATPPAPPRVVDQGSIFGKKSGTTNSNGTVGAKAGIGGNNNGDGRPGEVGDKGSPEGTLDGKSLYGKKGDGGGTTGGASVNITGWKKRSFTLPKDNSAETGRIVFRVRVDENGNVSILPAPETTVSYKVVNFYKSWLQSNLSNYLVADGTPPPSSTGTITINIKSSN